MTPLNFNLSDALPSLPKSGMPVTIITGFLGSGKTTLLNQILQNKDNLKIAVLVNEFGDINIDEQLLISVESDMIELGNGCICCSINDSFINTVYQVLEREEKIDYLVETKKTRISITGLKKIVKKTGLNIKKQSSRIIRPAYKFRFGIPQLRNPFSFLPIFNEIFSNGVSFLMIKKVK